MTEKQKKSPGTSVLRQGVWVLVCDGRKVLLLENEGDHVYPKLATRTVLEHSDQPSHDLGSDVPGRTFSGKDGRRSAIEPVDLQDVSEARFLKDVAAAVSRKVVEGEIAKLILVAPPHALAVLRRELVPAALAIVLAEVRKNLVQLPLYEIEMHLTQVHA